jgi:hypothetical protein
MINRLVMPNIISLYWIMTDSKFLLIFNGKNSDPLNHLFSTMWAEFIIPSVVVAPSLWRIQTSRHTFATFLSFSILFYEMSTAFLFYSMIRRHFQVVDQITPIMHNGYVFVTTLQGSHRSTAPEKHNYKSVDRKFGLILQCSEAWLA